MRFSKVTLIIKIASYGYNLWTQYKSDETALEVFGKKIIDEQIDEYNSILTFMGVEPIDVTTDDLIEYLNNAPAEIRKKVNEKMTRARDILDLL